MGRIEADIAPESWLFGFRPCSGQGTVYRIQGTGAVNPVIVWLASHVLPYLSLWVGCRL